MSSVTKNRPIKRKLPIDQDTELGPDSRRRPDSPILSWASTDNSHLKIENDFLKKRITDLEALIDQLRSKEELQNKFIRLLENQKS